MSTLGTRGKFAEGKVKAYLKTLEAKNCASYRWPDARAGSFVATPADFLIVHNAKATLLEVKEVNHSYRLPHGNASPDQIARMRNFQAAGAGAYVLIYFTPEAGWRIRPADYFLARMGGSWSFKDEPLLRLEQAFETILDK